MHRLLGIPKYARRLLRLLHADFDGITCVFDRVDTFEAFVAQASRVLADVKARAGRTGTLQ